MATASEEILEQQAKTPDVISRDKGTTQPRTQGSTPGEAAIKSGVVAPPKSQ